MIYYIIILMCCFLFVSFLSCSILIQQKTSKSIAGFEPSNHSGESRKVFQTSNCAGELLVFREGIQYTYMHTYIHTYHTIPYHTIPYHTIPCFLYVENPPLFVSLQPRLVKHEQLHLDFNSVLHPHLSPQSCRVRKAGDGVCMKGFSDKKNSKKMSNRYFINGCFWFP